jgi:DNA invertase Pin-like site-specific DNA recombinase
LHLKTFPTSLGLSAPWRQPEGVSAAKAKGVYKGRPRSIRRAHVAALMAEGLGATEIAKRLGIARSTVYRVA